MTEFACTFCGQPTDGETEFYFASRKPVVKVWAHIACSGEDSRKRRAAGEILQVPGIADARCTKDKRDGTFHAALAELACEYGAVDAMADLLRACPHEVATMGEARRWLAARGYLRPRPDAAPAR